MLDSARFIELLPRGPLILDGATGTELERRGVDCALPLWSARALRDAPEVVAAIHRDYVAAGADILVANTFRTNQRALLRAGLIDDAPRLNEIAIHLAREAATPADRPILIAGSIAPVEDCYHPKLVPPDDELAREHVAMVGWLRDAGADLLWIETMNTAREAAIAAAAARARGVPYVVSFVTREDGALLGGDSMADAVEAVMRSGPLAIGLNCIPPGGITAQLRQLRHLSPLPLIAYGHLGCPGLTPGWSFSEQATPHEYADAATNWLAAGATLIGGCCGTTPAHIAAVARRIKPVATH